MLTEMFYWVAALATTLTIGSALSARSTVSGVGKDVEVGGQKTHDESKDVEHRA